MAEAVSDWAQSQNSFTLRKIKIETRRCSDPDDLLEAINKTRITVRRAIDRQQRENERWRSVRCLGCFTPSFDGSMWSATFNGVLDLGRVHEVNFLDAVEPLARIHLLSFPAALIGNDIHGHVHFAFATTTGLKACDPNHLAAYFNTVNRNGGFKPLLFRRGFQS
jgi:hypothetical protein